MRVHELADDGTSTEREVAKFQSESELEAFLREAPSLVLDEDLLIIGQQVGVETGTLDLLAVDMYGNTVVIEIKKGDSGSGSASEASILSQPQEYARPIRLFSYEKLDDIYHELSVQLNSGRRSGQEELDHESLHEAFSDHFGTTLAKEAFNCNQRMVILAEEITERTAANARFLQDEGLHIQCVEVQRFRRSETRESSPIVVASSVVDYDLKRVQPEEQGAITFPDIVEAIAVRAFDDIGELTHAGTPAELFPAGYDKRTPRLRSLHPDHPAAVRYSIRVFPLEEGHVRLSIDVTDRELELDLDSDEKEPLSRQIDDAEDVFREADFDTHDRANWRTVTTTWEVESVSQIRSEAFLDEVANQYAKLIRVGHRAFGALDETDE